MKCVEMQKNLDALIDGELEISTKKKVETHAANCAACAAELANRRSLGEILWRNRHVSVPARLDRNVLSAFAELQRVKNPLERISVVAAPPKIGWFGIPRFAFAAAFVLCALTALAAFQIGKISARTNEFATGQNAPPQTAIETAKTAQIVKGNAASEKIQTIEVPVVKEKIVEKIIEVPVVREKILTRIVYVNAKNETSGNEQNRVPKTDAAAESQTVKSRLKENQFSTQINLEGFQVISELKPIIIRGESNEK